MAIHPPMSRSPISTDGIEPEEVPPSWTPSKLGKAFHFGRIYTRFNATSGRGGIGSPINPFRRNPLEYKAWNRWKGWKGLFY